MCHQVVSDHFASPWTVAHQAPLSTGFIRRESWSGLPFPPPGNLPDPGMAHMSPTLAGGFFTTEPPEKPFRVFTLNKSCQLSLPFVFVP